MTTINKLIMCKGGSVSCIIASTDKGLFSGGRCPACVKHKLNEYHKAYYFKKVKPKGEHPNRGKGRPVGSKNKPKVKPEVTPNIQPVLIST